MDFNCFSKASFLLLCIIFFCTSKNSFAQEKLINLSKVERIPFHHSPYFIERIVDARIDTTNIGMAQTGLMNRRRAAVLSKPLPEVVLGRIDQGSTVNRKPLILKILKFRVGERTFNTNEVGTIEAVVEFLVPDRHDDYKLIHRAAVSKTIAGLDVTAAHKHNFINAIKSVMLNFIRREVDLQIPISSDELAVVN